MLHWNCFLWPVSLPQSHQRVRPESGGGMSGDARRKCLGVVNTQYNIQMMCYRTGQLKHYYINQRNPHKKVKRKTSHNLSQLWGFANFTQATYWPWCKFLPVVHHGIFPLISLNFFIKILFSLKTTTTKRTLGDHKLWVRDYPSQIQTSQKPFRKVTEWTHNYNPQQAALRTGKGVRESIQFHSLQMTILKMFNFLHK